MKKIKFKASYLYLLVVFALLYAPIFYLIFYSFNDSDSMSRFTGFTWANYAAVFDDSRLLIIVLITFLLAFLSALLATIIGTFGAMGIYYTKRRKNRTALLSMNNILLVSPDVIIGASFLIFFTAVGFISLGFTSVLLSHVAFSIPIVVLMVLPKLQEMNDSMVDAARDLGANNFQVIKNIILPFLAPGIIAGYFMAFTYSLDDFAVTFFVTGNGFSTLAVEIYSRSRQGISLEINALSALVFLFSMVLVVGYYYISKDNRSRRAKRARRVQGGGVEITMKKLQSLFLGILVIIACLFLGVRQLENASGVTGADTLTIYNWGDYIDPQLIKAFEKETGYKVNYETFDSNEAMFTKIQQGGTAYDITIPSEYMIQKMMKENMLLPIDHAKLKGLNNIDPRFLNQPFDPNNQYSIPYFWGTLGIIYNDKFIDGSKIQHWNDLWRPELKDNVMLIDGAREVMGLSLNSLGYSLNSKNNQQLRQATDKLNTLTTNVKAIVADEIKMYMINEESAAAVTFSGEAAEMLASNSHLHYVIPEEGSNLWFDNLVIPKTAKNVKGAYAFINFMLRPENAAQNAEYIGYSTPNKAAKQLLPKEVAADKQFYPDDETINHLEVYQDLGAKYLGIYNDLFLEFKMYRK